MAKRLSNRTMQRYDALQLARHLAKYNAKYGLYSLVHGVLWKYEKSDRASYIFCHVHDYNIQTIRDAITSLYFCEDRGLEIEGLYT